MGRSFYDMMLKFCNFFERIKNLQIELEMKCYELFDANRSKKRKRRRSLFKVLEYICTYYKDYSSKHYVVVIESGRLGENDLQRLVLTWYFDRRSIDSLIGILDPQYYMRIDLAKTIPDPAIRQRIKGYSISLLMIDSRIVELAKELCTRLKRDSKKVRALG